MPEKNPPYRRLTAVGSSLFVERLEILARKLNDEMGGRYLVATGPAERMRA